MTKDLINKLIEEDNELEGRIARLAQFINHSEDYLKLTWHHKRLLEAQMYAMQNYETILRMRISDIENGTNEGDDPTGGVMDKAF